MAERLENVVEGIFSCMNLVIPRCENCPYYRGYANCKESLRDDISYWAKLGKLKLGTDGVYHPADIPEKKVKTKRKNGRRYFDGERRSGRHEQYGESDRDA